MFRNYSASSIPQCETNLTNFREIEQSTAAKCRFSIYFRL